MHCCKNKDLFSIVIICYKNYDLIYDCIDSVIFQDYPKIEMIIADDCSIGINLNEIEKYIKSRCRSNIVNICTFSNKTNLGTVKNINKALRKCNGDYIKIIAADDAFFHPSVLTMAKNQLIDCEIVVSDVMKCDRELNNIGICKKFPQSKIKEMSPAQCFKKMCYSNIIDAQGVFMKNTFFVKYGLFDEDFKLLEDWPKWLQITRDGCKIGYIPSITCKYRTNIGVFTSVNPIIIKDLRTAFKKYIKPNKYTLGIFKYIKSYIRMLVVSSLFVRKIYGFIWR